MEGIRKWVLIGITTFLFIGFTHIIYGEEIPVQESTEKKDKDIVSLDTQDQTIGIQPTGEESLKDSKKPEGEKVAGEEPGERGAAGVIPPGLQDQKIGPGPSWKKEKRKSSQKPDKDAPVVIEADLMEHNKETDMYEAWGHVKITQGNAYIECDYANLDNETGDALALGSVWYEDEDSILISDEVELNFDTKLGIAYKGRIFQLSDGYDIDGEDIEKIGDETYNIKKGSFTTCDAVVPAWKFRGRNIRVYLDDSVKANDAVFYIKDLPVLYTPYISIPIKKDRHSGFLFPRFGSGNKEGFIFQPAYYWVMADNMDSTYYLDYKSKLGIGGAVEYRYVLSKDSRGDIYNYYFRDQDLKKDFWEVRFNHDQQITDRLQAKANITYVNDPTFYQRLSTITDERIQSGLESNVQISQNWQSSRAYVLGQYSQNLTTLSNSEALQKLPEIGYVLTNYQIGDYPLYVSLDSTAINFWRETGLKGQRLNIYPQISYTLNLGRGFVFSPKAGFRERAYVFEGNRLDKGIYNLGANLGTKVFRVFETDSILGGMEKIKHSIEPFVDYTYIPDVYQDNLPKWDGYDSIAKTNSVNYGITTRLIGKYGEEKQKKTLEFFTFRVSDYYYLDKDYNEKPLSDILMEGTIRSMRLLSFSGAATLSPYGKGVTSFNTSLNLRGDTTDSSRYWYLSLDQRYIKEPESLFFTLSGSKKLFNSLDLSGKIWYDATQRKFNEVDVQTTYSRQCWAFTLVYIGRPDETQILMTIDLKGIGAVKLPSFSPGAM